MTDDLVKRPRWEFFSDIAYFDMWAVRPEGKHPFGAYFHVPSQDEAAGLADLLNTNADLFESQAREISDLTVAVENSARIREAQDREIAELKRRLARWESAPVVATYTRIDGLRFLDKIHRDSINYGAQLIARPTEE